MKRAALLFVFAVFTLFSYCYGQDTTNMTGSTGKMNMPAAQMTQTIIDQEKAVVDAVKNKNADQYKDFLTDDYIGVYSDGILNRDEDTQTIKDLDLRDFTMSDEKVVFPTNDVAIITYKAKATGNYKGKDFSVTKNVSSTWVNRNGKWLNAAYAEALTPSDEMK